MLSKQLKDIFYMNKDFVESKIPGFHEYFNPIFRYPQRFDGYLRRCRYVYSLTDSKEKKILDIGCGFGLISILFADFGAKEVTGIDTNREEISGFRKILSSLRPPPDNVNIILGDALNICNIKSHFDVVIANHVISHIRDIDLFLAEVNKVLCNGGILFIVGDNNSFNIFQRIKNKRIWNWWESKWFTVRRDIIRKRAPSLDENTLDLLAKETAGMWGNDIVRSVDEYLSCGKMRKKPNFKFRNPKTGEFEEFLFNPFNLKRRLSDFGFKVEIIRPFYPAIHPTFIKNYVYKMGTQLIQLFHPFSQIMSPELWVLAKKGYQSTVAQ